MRAFTLAALLSVATIGPALADATIAGNWRGDMGNHVVMNMTITDNGQWNSETRQGETLVSKMEGSYHQTPRSQTRGRVVFVPTHAETSATHGAARRETDQYSVADNGQVLRLTSGGDTMVFHKTSP